MCEYVFSEHPGRISKFCLLLIYDSDLLCYCSLYKPKNATPINIAIVKMLSTMHDLSQWQRFA